jgi:hypothetical protein
MVEERREKDTAYRALQHLRALREFERAHLPFIRTLEDRDLLCEIGHRMAAGSPLSLKELFLLGFGSMATVHRRLRHLRRQNAIVQRPCEHDRRSVELVLNPRLLAVFAAYQAVLAKAG